MPRLALVKGGTFRNKQVIDLIWGLSGVAQRKQRSERHKEGKEGGGGVLGGRVCGRRAELWRPLLALAAVHPLYTLLLSHFVVWLGRGSLDLL